MGQLGFYIDQNYCTGCKACQVACIDKNDLPEGVRFRRVAEYSGGTFTERPDGSFDAKVFTYYTSISCNHCEDPICVKVCPTTAIHKEEGGIVVVDPDKCVGCRYCEWACPYGAPQFDANAGVMTKCNFCTDLIAKGKEPACVAACPSRVLKYGDIEELRKTYGDTADVEPLPDPAITHPSLVITPHRHAQKSGYGVGELANASEL
jgi:anaerobic dimethyl sulfoxide reductase subunit B (iron-sulfur subunit)